MDLSFLDRLEQIVNENLNNEQFGVEDLAEAVSLSRFQIHRKLQAATGQSISQFIREIRLNKAFELLKKGNMSASEISYKVGFGSTTYFTKCFTEYYNITPGELKKLENSNATEGNKINTGNSERSELKSRESRKPVFGREIIRRRIPQAVLMYLLISWLVLQIINVSGTYLEVSSNLYFFVLIVLCLLFPLAVFLAWHYENSSQGFVKIKTRFDPRIKHRGKPFTGLSVGLSILVIIASTYLVPSAPGASDQADAKTGFPVRDIKQSLAVLPFRSLSTNREDDYLAESMKETILFNLHEISELVMPSPNATQQYKNTSKSFADIARELQVRYLLYGSVQKFSDTLRIVVKVYDQFLDEIVFQKRYSESAGMLSSVVDDAAVTVSSAVNALVVPDNQKSSSEPLATDSKTLDLYMRGSNYFGIYINEWNDNDLLFAEGFYKKALESDGNFAPAYVGLGNTAKLKSRKFGMIEYPTKFYQAYEDTMKMYAEQAMVINPDLAEAHLLMADFYFYRGERDRCISSINRALQLKENLSYAYFLLAVLWCENNDPVQAFRNICIAEYLENSGTQAHNILYQKGVIYSVLSDHSNASRCMRKAAQLTPGTSMYLQPYIFSNLMSGQFDHTEELLDSVSDRFDDHFYLFYGMLYTWTNRPEQALKKLRQSPEFDFEKELNLIDNDKSDLDHLAAYNLFRLGYTEHAQKLFTKMISEFEESNRINLLSEVYAEMGEYEKSLKSLSELEKTKPYAPLFELSKFLPAYDNLRSRPEYKELIERIDRRKIECLEEIRKIETFPPSRLMSKNL